jgi:hypothetical protein
MTGNELAVRWGRLLVRHLWRSLPARIPPSTGVSVRYVHVPVLSGHSTN